jgi:Spy/CpxP family protein refolding chaperone
MSLKFSAIALSIALVGLAAVFSPATSAQQRPARSFDPLTRLKKTIEEASVTALSADQETQLRALIEARHSNREGHQAGLGSEFEAARAAYDAAILAGDQAKANAQAAIIASLSTAATKSRLEADAKFKLDVLAVLKTGGQLDALTQKLSSEGLLRLLGSLSGGPGGPGGPRGPGRPGRPPGGPNGDGGPRRP